MNIIGRIALGFLFCLLCYTMWFKNFSLEGLGAYFAGVAALLGVVSSLPEYFQRKKIVAASHLLAVCKYSIEYICKIMKEPERFQYKGFNPFYELEINKKNSIEYPERPAKLIKNQINRLKKNALKDLPWITGDEAVILDTLLQKIISLCSKYQQSVGDYLHKNYTEEIKRRTMLQFRELSPEIDLKKLLDEFEEVIKPVISGGLNFKLWVSKFTSHKYAWILILGLICIIVLMGCKTVF